MLSAVDGQSAENYDRDWMGHVAPEATWRRANFDSSGGERVIADDLRTVTGNVGSGRAFLGVGAGAALQPLIECRHAAVEGVEGVPFIERYRGSDRHVRSQGAGVCIVRISLSFGRGGASSAARNLA